MNSFTITFNAAVQGFWGWWVVWGLVAVLVSMIVSSIVAYIARGKFEGTSEHFLVAAFAVGFALVFAGMGAGTAHSEASRETYEEQRQAALTEAGYPLSLHEGDMISLSDEDGSMALYTSVEETDGDNHSITYYQISP